MPSAHVSAHLARVFETFFAPDCSKASSTFMLLIACHVAARALNPKP